MRIICFVIGEFEAGSPAQHLLDRFLIGYQRDGEFVEPKDLSVIIKTEKVSELLRKRMDAHGVKLGDVPDAKEVVVVDAASAVQSVVWALPGTRVFVYGALGRSKAEWAKILGAANSHGIELFSGTEVATALRVPELNFHGRLREALIVVNGKFPAAELRALDGLLSLISKPKGIRGIRHWQGSAVWGAGEKREWSWGLLRAALSRTDSPLGNAMADGRTEDLAGLGLVPKMASDPRAWVIELADGAKLELLVLDGVVGDTVAAANVNGRVVSTQLFQAPSPAREDFSRLAAVIDDFFHTGKALWGVERSRMIVEALDEFSKLRE